MSNDLLETIQAVATCGIAYWTFRTKRRTDNASKKSDIAAQHSAAAAAQSKSNGEDIDTLKVEMNGHIRELLALTRQAGYAAGVKSETDKKV
jgi:hypothetical protein